MQRSLKAGLGHEDRGLQLPFPGVFLLAHRPFQKNTPTWLTAPQSTDRAVRDVDHPERSGAVLVLKPGAGVALWRGAACAGSGEIGMEPKELLSTSWGCGIMSNNITTSFRGICSLGAKVTSLCSPVAKFVSFFPPHFALRKKHIKFALLVEHPRLAEVPPTCQRYH